MTEPAGAYCDVYWGSHGCCLSSGHKGDHLCTCTFEDDDPSRPMLPHMNDSGPEDGHENNGNVGRPPYYGPSTTFYGDDVRCLGLPHVRDEHDG